MQGMDVVVVPSRWEGFALIPLEAMRAGKPVVVSNMSSLKEVVINGFNGWVFANYNPRSLADCLNSLKSADCKLAGINARSVFEKTFTFDNFYKKIISVYDKVCK